MTLNIKFRCIVLQIAILAICNTYLYSQINLVYNPSFEILSQYPNSGNQISYADGWGTFISGGGSTPDLYSEYCTVPQLCGVPYHSLGFQFPNNGGNYAGIIATWSSQPNTGREYIQSKLNQKLKSGDEYCLKIFCNLSDFSTAYISSLGVYLDDGSISTTSPYGLPTVTPQIFSQQYLNDTVYWVKIEGVFVATGIEEYISIGNFFLDSLSGIGFFEAHTSWMSYYYIDDVSVIPANLPAYAGNDTLIQPGDSVFIGRQPEIGLDEDCIWFVNGVPIDTVAGLWVQPDTTTTYVVQQTICGNVTWDTVTVTVDTGVGMAAFELNQRFRVYPNPATNVLTIESPISNGILCISNLLGQEVLRQPINDKVSEIDISKLGKGVYFVRVEGRNGFVVRKVMIE